MMMMIPTLFDFQLIRLVRHKYVDGLFFFFQLSLGLFVVWSIYVYKGSGTICMNEVKLLKKNKRKEEEE